MTAHRQFTSERLDHGVIGASRQPVQRQRSPVDPRRQVLDIPFYAQHFKNSPTFIGHRSLLRRSFSLNSSSRRSGKTGH